MILESCCKIFTSKVLLQVLNFFFFTQCSYLELLYPSIQNTMAPLQIPKNFKFEPLYPFPLPLQDEVGPSSSSPPTSNDSPPIILTKSSLKNLS